MRLRCRGRAGRCIAAAFGFGKFVLAALRVAQVGHHRRKDLRKVVAQCLAVQMHPLWPVRGGEDLGRIDDRSRVLFYEIGQPHWRPPLWIRQI